MLVARSFNQLQEAAEELAKEFPGTQFLPVACDIRDEASVKAVFEQVREVFGTADVLVNNAGASDEGKPLRSASIANVWDTIVRIFLFLFQVYALRTLIPLKEINLKGPLLVVHEFLNLVGTSREAVVINVTSAMGFVVIPGKASYSLSKLALTHLSRYIAAENPNVRAISLHPGTIMTDIMSAWLVRFAKDTPELAGGCAVWLTTKEAAFLNGRYVSANWSVDELASRSSEIVEGKKLVVNHTGERAY